MEGPRDHQPAEGQVTGCKQVGGRGRFVVMPVSGSGEIRRGWVGARRRVPVPGLGGIKESPRRRRRAVEHRRPAEWLALAGRVAVVDQGRLVWVEIQALCWASEHVSSTGRATSVTGSRRTGGVMVESSSGHWRQPARPGGHGSQPRGSPARGKLRGWGLPATAADVGDFEKSSALVRTRCVGRRQRGSRKPPDRRWDVSGIRCDHVSLHEQIGGVTVDHSRSLFRSAGCFGESEWQAPVARTVSGSPPRVVRVGASGRSAGEGGAAGRINQGNGMSRPAVGAGDRSGSWAPLRPWRSVSGTHGWCRCRHRAGHGGWLRSQVGARRRGSGGSRSWLGGWVRRVGISGCVPWGYHAWGVESASVVR